MVFFIIGNASVVKRNSCLKMEASLKPQQSSNKILMPQASRPPLTCNQDGRLQYLLRLHLKYDINQPHPAQNQLLYLQYRAESDKINPWLGRPRDFE